MTELSVDDDRGDDTTVLLQVHRRCVGNPRKVYTGEATTDEVGEF